MIFIFPIFNHFYSSKEGLLAFIRPRNISWANVVKKYKAKKISLVRKPDVPMKDEIIIKKVMPRDGKITATSM